jgi:MATE family multidrug resistance protein
LDDWYLAMAHGRRKDEEDCTTAALLRGDGEAWKEEEWHHHQHASCDLWRRRVCEESRKLWEVVGPAIFTCTATYSLNVIMQAFAGHLGDLELASVSFACTVLTGFNYGLMVSSFLSILIPKLCYSGCKLNVKVFFSLCCRIHLNPHVLGGI